MNKEKKLSLNLIGSVNNVRMNKNMIKWWYVFYDFFWILVFWCLVVRFWYLDIFIGVDICWEFWCVKLLIWVYDGFYLVNVYNVKF